MFRELAKRAKKINVRQLALKVAQANEGLITDNVIDQLDVGIAGDGKRVGEYTTDRYSKFKRREGSNAPFGVVNLKLTGALYKGIRTRVLPTQVITNVVGVLYSKYQIKRYGKRVYENTKEHANEVKNTNSKDTVRAYSKALGI
jgi:hypothetical protein